MICDALLLRLDTYEELFGVEVESGRLVPSALGVAQTEAQAAVKVAEVVEQHGPLGLVGRLELIGLDPRERAHHVLLHAHRRSDVRTHRLHDERRRRLARILQHRYPAAEVRMQALMMMTLLNHAVKSNTQISLHFFFVFEY